MSDTDVQWAWFTVIIIAYEYARELLEPIINMEQQQPSQTTESVVMETNSSSHTEQVNRKLLVKVKSSLINIFNIVKFKSFPASYPKKVLIEID